MTGPAEHHYATTTRIDGHNMTIVGRAEKNGSTTLHVEGTSIFSASGALELVSEQDGGSIRFPDLPNVRA